SSARGTHRRYERRANHGPVRSRAHHAPRAHLAGAGSSTCATRAATERVCDPSARPRAEASGLLLAVLVEDLRETLRDRLRVAALDVVALHHVDELAVLEQRDLGRARLVGLEVLARPRDGLALHAR